MATPEFISEPIKLTGEFLGSDSAARGLVAVPAGFVWREREYRIVELLAKEKASSPEGGKAGNEVYLRREYLTVLLDDGREAVIYFERQARLGQNPKQRWFIYTIADADTMHGP